MQQLRRVEKRGGPLWRFYGECGQGQRAHALHVIDNSLGLHTRNIRRSVTSLSHADSILARPTYGIVLLLHLVIFIVGLSLFKGACDHIVCSVLDYRPQLLVLTSSVRL